MRLSLTLAVVLALPVSGFLLGVGVSGQPRPVDDNKGWTDYHDLDQKDRLKERPGSYEVLRAVADFLTAMYKVRPDYSGCAFPFQEDSKTIKSLAEADKRLDDATRGQTRTNKLRQYNVNVRSLTVYDPDEMLRSAELQRKAKFRGSRLERLRAVRARHPGRAVLVLANLALESLQSPKVEGGEEEDIVFYVAHREDRWKVAWFDK